MSGKGGVKEQERERRGILKENAGYMKERGRALDNFENFPKQNNQFYENWYTYYI